MITTLIFNLDGILIDLCKIHKKVFCEALLRIGGLSVSTYCYDNYLEGLPTRTKLQKIGINGRTAIDVEDLKQNLTLEEIKKIQEDIQLREILLELSNDFDLFCVSDSINKTTEIVLKNLNIIDLFQAYYGNDNVFCSKPSPEIYLKCMVQTPAMPENTLGIESSLVGQETVKNVGCHGLILKNREELTLETIMKIIEEIEREE